MVASLGAVAVACVIFISVVRSWLLRDARFWQQGERKTTLELLLNHDETSTAGICRAWMHAELSRHQHTDTQPAGADVLL